MMPDRTWVLERRLAVQGLGASRFESAVEAVQRLACVQSQELILGLSALGYRSSQSALKEAADEMTAGAFVRLHILRPTWHFVAVSDLRWILAATSPKVERSLAHRHRSLGLDAGAFETFLERLRDLLKGRSLTRPELRAEFPEYDGSAMGHLLLVAELRALVCSGPYQGAAPTYRLVDDFIVPENVDVEEAKVRLIHRFFAGHGPSEIADLTRWAAFTKTEVRNAIADLGDNLEKMVVEGLELYHDPSVGADYQPGDYLLHTFDEVTLTYPRLNFPRSPGHPLGETPGPFLDNGFAGALISGTVCPGGWRMSTRGEQVTFRLQVVPKFRARAEAAAEEFASYLGRPFALTWQ